MQDIITVALLKMGSVCKGRGSTFSIEDLTPIEKGDKNENDRDVSPEIISIHFSVDIKFHSHSYLETC